MSRIALRGLAVGLAALLPALAARGSAKEGVELDRALQAIENGTDASRSGDASLTRLVAKLEQRYAARRLEFAEVARRPLPAKAAERLTQAQAAHEAGQGHLLELLRAIARPARDANQDARAARAREARALLAQLGVASRQEPLSAELKLRAPAWQPAALPRATGTHFEEPPAGPIGPIPAQLQLLADSLNGPIEIYAWVRNNLRPEFYYGSMKGPLQAFLDRSGNDADTAAVLVALLRAKGIPARYVQGLAEVDIGRLMAVTGTSSVEQSLRVLQRAGIPYEPVNANSNIVSGVKLARVWAEAYVPYVNYRGLPLDAQGKLWVPFDAAFKNLVQPGGQMVVRDLGLVPQALVDEYLAQPRSQTPLEFARQQVTALLAPSGHTYEQALNNRGWASEELGILPNALPYVPSGPTDVTYDPPLAHHVRVVGEWNGTTLIDATLALPDILGQRLTLSYVPFDDDDARTVAQFGGLTHTPPYLVQVKPLLKVGGIVTAIGEAPIGAAVKFDLKVVLSSPGGEEELHNQVLAGNLMAIGLAGGEDTGVEQQSEHAAALLSRAAFQYLRNWNQSDAELANLFRVAPVRPTASACFVMSDIEVEYAGGDPLYPVTFEWKGVAIDADLRSSAPVGIDSRAEEKDFTLLSGLEGSILENRLFEDLWHVGSVSTAKALQIAAQQGVLVLTLTRDNVDVLLPGLPLDPQSKEEIRDAALRGFTVRVPAAPVTYLAWTGVGWWILDEETGESAWQLQGGHSGGVTAAASIDWPDQQLVETIVDQGEAAAPEATPVAQVRKFVSTDFQDGIVDKPLGRPFRVLALDAEGQRVPKAPVTFQVIGGGGSLLDPATGRAEAGTLTVLANDRGEAEATLVLGKRTDEIPRYVCLEAEPCSVENEVWGTLVGLNLVTVVSGTGVLSEPFTAYGAPDDQFDGTSRYAYLSANSWPSGDGVWNLSVAGLLAINVRDQHGNPLSNFRVRFAYKAPPELGTPPPGWQLARGATDTPGKLLRLRDYVACLVGTPSPRWGECAGESEELIVPSTIYGSVSYPVLGDSPYSAYKFDIGTEAEPSASTLSLGTWGYLCSPTCDTWWGRWPDTLIDVDSRPVLFGRRGDMIEAYAPSTSAEMKFSAQALYEGYEVEPFVDDQGTKHYRVKGNNRWTREPLDDSTFELNPATPGTGASPSPASSVGNGVYTSQMVMSGTPQLNTVNFTSKNTPLLIPHNLPDHNDEVDPAAVDESTLQITKRKYPDRPWLWNGSSSLWGVKPEIVDVVPSPIILTKEKTLAAPAQVSYSIQPPAYAALLDATEVRLDINRGDQLILAGSAAGGAPFTIPQGLRLEPGRYDASLVILGVSVNPQDIRSSSVPFSAIALDLVADTNRDGRVDDKDEPGKADWTKTRGAIFNVNLDSDGSSVTPRPDAVDFDDDGVPISENFEIENDEDAKDVAPVVLRGLAAPLPPNIRVFLRAADPEDIQSIHVFKKIAAGERAIWGSLGDRIPSGSAEPIEKDVTEFVDPASPTFAGAGPSGDVTFGIEGMFFRNLGATNHFNGDVRLFVELRRSGVVLATDLVQLKVAPWLMLPHTQPSTEVWAGDFGSTSTAFLSGLFASGQLHALAPIDLTGQWFQDHIETGYYQRPGGPATLATFRLPYPREVYQPRWPRAELLRPDAATFQFGIDLGPDTGGLSAGAGNFGGNVEILPATPAHPLGRIVTGSTRSADLRTFLDSQEAQPPVEVPTRWLKVGHFDEVFAFLPTAGQVVAADPADAYRIMRAIPVAERGRAVFFATGSDRPRTGVVSASPTAANRLETGIDLTGSTWKYVRIYSDSGSGAAGQVARIVGPPGNGFLLVDKVWKVGSKIVPADPRPPLSALPDSIYYDAFEHARDTPSSPTWFVPPASGDRYVLVQGTRSWRGVLGGDVPAFITVEEVLKDRDLEDLNLVDAQGQIAAGRSALQAAAGGGLTFVSVPTIYVGLRTGFGDPFRLPAFNFDVGRMVVAYTPGLANVQPVAASLYFPRQYGPRDAAGNDLFEATTKSRLPAAQFIDDWDLYHRNDGEVHCGTTVVRTPPALDWWTRQP